MGIPARYTGLRPAGRGLYASRLARLGHRCVGIDFSPASIDYAREQAVSEDLPCDYIHAGHTLG